jgi:two-component system phosphate regulon sensor histidine kinase PhoR
MNRMARELDRSVAALVQERDRLDAVLQGMSDAVIAIDRDARITLLNKATNVLLDIPEGAVGKPLVDVVRIPALVDLAGRASGEPQSAELSLGLTQVRHLQARANPIRATGGTVIVIHDTTEMRRLETIRRDFVANVSHELRTPVSVILANAETLLAGALDHPEHARRFTDAIHRNAERLSAIIADLLDLTRIESGKLQLRPEPVDLHDAAEHAIDAVAEMARSRGTQVTNQIAPDLLVVGDVQALDQILMNLVTNAVKYSGERRHVVLRARAEGTEVRVEVEDDGPGIEEHHRERVFERFYRVDAGRSRDVGGTGLGLSIVKHLVTALDGRLGVEPVSPHGARFWFTLPLAR